MKKQSKTFIAKVIVKSSGKKPVPDWGLGKGVLSEQEVQFTDERGRGWNSPLFLMEQIELEKEILDQVVEVKWIEKKR